MTQHLTTPAAIALGFGLTSSAWISGNIFSLSYMAVPAVLSAPSTSTPTRTLTTQWTKMYHIGRSAMPKAAVLTLASYLYVAWTLRSSGKTAAVAAAAAQCSSGFAAAGLLTVGIAPFTLATMMGTNNLLEANSTSISDSPLTAGGGGGAKEGGEPAGAVATLPDDEARELIRKWKVLNAIRSLFPLLGAVVGMCSLFRLHA